MDDFQPPPMGLSLLGGVTTELLLCSVEKGSISGFSKNQFLVHGRSDCSWYDICPGLQDMNINGFVIFKETCCKTPRSILDNHTIHGWT